MTSSISTLVDLWNTEYTIIIIIVVIIIIIIIVVVVSFMQGIYTRIIICAKLLAQDMAIICMVSSSCMLHLFKVL
jgi:hypothetical protein